MRREIFTYHSRLDINIDKMRAISKMLLWWPLSVFFLLGCAGCVTNESGGAVRYETKKTFYLSVSSDPPGATVVQDRRGREVVLGETPLQIPIKFAKKPAEGFLGQMGLRTWQQLDPLASPWEMSEVSGEKKFHLSLSDVTLRHEGYDDEPFGYDWKLAKDFQTRNALGEITGSEPLRQETTVVMRKPVKPEFYRILNLKAVVPGMTLSRPAADGPKMTLIGDFPISLTYGFGRIRNQEGEIQEWIRWKSKNDPDILSFDKKGVLLLSAWLEAPGYEPDHLHMVPVYVVNVQDGKNIDIPLQMTTPKIPQSTFLLKVDSLPTGSDVFELLPDGTLGEKVGETPFELEIGIGQKLKLDEHGKYRHDDWLIWLPNRLINWEKMKGNITSFYLACGMFQDGFAIEKIEQEIFRLVPGNPLPTQRTLNVPLLHPEQAAVRDAQKKSVRLEPVPASAPTPSPRAFVWKEPDLSNSQKPEASEEKTSFWGRWRRQKDK